MNLCNRTGEERGQQTLHDRRDNNFVQKTFCQSWNRSLKRSFYKRPENININWRSWWNTHGQVIALSHFSQPSVFPSFLSSCCVNSLIFLSSHNQSKQWVPFKCFQMPLSEFPLFLDNKYYIMQLLIQKRNKKSRSVQKGSRHL